MKKVIFLVAALMAVFSGIAAVSAYEGHQIDVKAHLENALMVEKYEVDFGIVFPQEKIETQFKVGLSESFMDQERYSTVEYKMYWEPKPIEEGIMDPDKDGFFQPIFPYIEVKNDGVVYPNAAFINKGNGIWEIGAADLDNSADTCDIIHFKLNPPVFDKWYNKATDDLNGNTPSAVLVVPQYYTTVEEAECGFEAVVPHTDLGSNFKIQVTDIIIDLGP
jgi:hypothetical protein